MDWNQVRVTRHPDPAPTAVILRSPQGDEESVTTGYKHAGECPAPPQTPSHYGGGLGWGRHPGDDHGLEPGQGRIPALNDRVFLDAACVSVHYFNNEDDVDQLLETTAALLKR